MANTSNAMGDSRAFSFNQASINNISRIEVAKVPTPANRRRFALRLGQHGQQERLRAEGMQFRYNLNLAANSENFSLARRRTPPTSDIYKI
jgi:hypothetical protein